MYSNVISNFTEEFLLEEVSEYRYLTQGNLSVTALDDMELYKELIHAFNIMGVPSEEQNGELCCSSSLAGWVCWLSLLLAAADVIWIDKRTAGFSTHY